MTNDLEASVDVEQEHWPTGTTTIVWVRGDLDMALSEKVSAIGLLAAQSGESFDMVIDLSGVAFIDSTGLGALVNIRDAATEVGRRLWLRAPTDRVTRALELSGLTTYFLRV